MGDVDLAVDEGTDQLMAKTKMILVEVRSGVKTVYGARCEYQLVEMGNTFKMRMKKVILLDNDEALGNLTFIL